MNAGVTPIATAPALLETRTPRDCPAALKVSKGFLEKVMFLLRPEVQAGNS